MLTGSMDDSKLNDRFARGLSWAVALVSLGAMLWTDGSSRGAELSARMEASPPGSRSSSGTVTAANLVGMEESAAVALLGAPSATESRPPADVWRYASPRCKLELVFYMEMRTGRMRSLHYAFKGEAETPEQREACLTAIQETTVGPAGDKPERQVAVEFPSENTAVPVAEPVQEAPRYAVLSHRVHTRRHLRWYAKRPVRSAGWGYAFALRYPRLPSARAGRADPSSNYAAATSGWGGGLFGPAPYSGSGP